MRRRGMMADAEAAFADLRQAVSAKPGAGGIHVFLASRSGREKSERWRRLRFARGTAQKFRAEMFDALAARLNDDPELVQFVEDLAGSRIGVLRLADLKSLADWLSDVPAPDWPHTFDPEQDFFARIAFQATRLFLGAANEEALVFRARTRAALLKRGSFLAIRTARDEFEILDHDVYDFATDADFLVWRGFTFVLRQRAFETITDQRAATQGMVRQAVEALGAIKGLSVAGLDGIADAVSTRPQLARKLAAAVQMDTFAAIQPELAAKLVEDRKLTVGVTRENGEVRFSVDPAQPEQVRDFVELVADDYVRGIITSREYRTLSKEPV